MLASRRMSAYLSEPTQPMKRTEEGGRMYCFCRETKKKGFGKCAGSDLSEFGFLIERKEWETGGGVEGVCVYLLEHHERCFGRLHRQSIWHRSC